MNRGANMRLFGELSQENDQIIKSRHFPFFTLFRFHQFPKFDPTYYPPLNYQPVLHLIPRNLNPGGEKFVIKKIKKGREHVHLRSAGKWMPLPGPG